jgi:lipopolysaccharide/colanic/teichoic acid biosynthesis glycosyltransferase
VGRAECVVVERRREYGAKRWVDLMILTAFALPVLIVGVICALAIRLTSPGPVLFRQERIGWGGEPFEILKFRTMRVGDNPLVPDQDCITRVGAILRRLSLDELPQFWNVLRGDMSFIGPRPTIARQVAKYTPRQRERLSVRPGLTGLAQVNGRNALDWATRIEFDVRYAEIQSARVDLGIVARTFWVVLSGRGVDGHQASDPMLAPTDGVVIDLREVRQRHDPTSGLLGLHPLDRGGPAADDLGMETAGA